MDAYNRHNEVICLKRYPGTIDARYFNLVRTALKRIKGPIRYKIPKLMHLDLLIQDDAWIVVDRVLHDMPVAAWTDFHTENRDNLNEPIPCEIRLFHFAAGAILNSTLGEMENMLSQDLAEANQDESHKVLSFKQEHKE